MVHEVHMYVCMVSHIYQDHGSTGYGCQSCSWSAEQEKKKKSCPRLRLRIWSPETSSAVPSRVSLLVPILRLNLMLTFGVPPDFRGGVHYLLITARRHRVSPEVIGSRNCVPMAVTTESPPAQGQ